MGYDSNGQFVPESRNIAPNVLLHEAGQFSAASKAALKALPPGLRFDGLEAVVTAGRSKWTFSAASTATDATDELVLTPDSGTGRWLRADKAIHLKLAVAFGTADAAVLFTVAAGFRLYVERAFWEITADWTGGTSSAIGLSSSQAGYTTKGDMLGAGSGDVAALLVAAAPPVKGTVGAKLAGTNACVLDAAATVRFDRITSAFTAGTGFAHLFARTIS
jgi:hypothetical protein